MAVSVVLCPDDSMTVFFAADESGLDNDEVKTDLETVRSGPQDRRVGRRKTTAVQSVIAWTSRGSSARRKIIPDIRVPCRALEKQSRAARLRTRPGIHPWSSAAA